MTEREMIEKLLHYIHQDMKRVVVATTKSGVRFGLCRVQISGYEDSTLWFHVCHSDDAFPLSEIVDIEIQDR